MININLKCLFFLVKLRNVKLVSKDGFYFFSVFLLWTYTSILMLQFMCRINATIDGFLTYLHIHVFVCLFACLVWLFSWGGGGRGVCVCFRT